MKMTKEQIIKINEKCKNGFKFDVESFIYHGERGLKKRVFLDPAKESYIEVCLYYNTSYYCFEKQVKVMLSISNKFTKDKATGLYCSSGLGEYIEVEEIGDCKRLTIEKLIKLTDSKVVVEAIDKVLTKENLKIA